MSAGPALDTAAWSSAWRHRATGEKVLLAGGLLACAVGLPAWPVAPVVLVITAGLLLGPARVPARLLARAARGVAWFVVLGCLTLAVARDPGPGAVGVHWRGLGWAVTDASLRQAGTTGGHALAGASAMFLLAATTPMTDLLRWAARRGVPAAVVEIADLTYRFVFVLLATTRAVHAAQTARLGYTSRKAALASSSQLVAAVLVRAWERARRLQDGLEGRGFDGTLRVWEPARRPSPRFVAAGLVLPAGLVALGLVWR
ncbi:MAG: cobalt ECF transporter T component CbiQ [Kineosporiaceae bacterium]